MLTEPQKRHLIDATKRVMDSLNREQLRRLYFLVDDILQYGGLPAAFIIHHELKKWK